MNRCPNAALVEDTAVASIRACPFCGSHAELVGAGGSGYGVTCSKCGVCFLAINPTREAAINLWNQRRTISYWGGKATVGISTRRKRRACRRNLKLARQALEAKLTWTKIEPLMPILQASRQAELAKLEQAAVAARARLKELVPNLADPTV